MVCSTRPWSKTDPSWPVSGTLDTSAKGHASPGAARDLRQIRRAGVRTNGPIEYHVDGEPGVADDAIEIGIRPRALWVRI